MPSSTVSPIAKVAENALSCRPRPLHPACGEKNAFVDGFADRKGCENALSCRPRPLHPACGDKNAFFDGFDYRSGCRKRAAVAAAPLAPRLRGEECLCRWFRLSQRLST
jgi:hypothetical protein